MRTNFDFTPDFDRLFALRPTRMHGDGSDVYPPFDNVHNEEYSYRIAVAAFRPDEIEVVAWQNQLTITGKRVEDGDQGERPPCAPSSAASSRGLHRGQIGQFREQPAHDSSCSMPFPKR